MLWSIDSCQKEYPLTIVTWLYRGRVQLNLNGIVLKNMGYVSNTIVCAIYIVTV